MSAWGTPPPRTPTRGDRAARRLWAGLTRPGPDGRALYQKRRFLLPVVAVLAFGMGAGGDGAPTTLTETRASQREPERLRERIAELEEELDAAEAGRARAEQALARRVARDAPTPAASGSATSEMPSAPAVAVAPASGPDVATSGAGADPAPGAAADPAPGAGPAAASGAGPAAAPAPAPAPPPLAPAPEPAPRPAAPPPPPVPVAPAQAAGCDPNYSGCVPMYPPDVDCGDLTSDNIAVLGTDVHGLDGNDNDGVGCES